MLGWRTACAGLAARQSAAADAPMVVRNLRRVVCFIGVLPLLENSENHCPVWQNRTRCTNSHNLLKAEKLCKLADVIAAASIDAQLGSPAAFDKDIHLLRPHPGQIVSAANLAKLLKNSSLRDTHVNCEHVQDAYSMRCTPQVHGAIRANLAYVRSILEIEINSATDNPLIFPEKDKVISGGNFHGEPVAIAADSFGIAVAELANLSERRMERLLNPALSRGLKPFLANNPGLDSGFMIAQYTAASFPVQSKVPVEMEKKYI